MAKLGRDAVTAALRDRLVGGLHAGRLLGGERLPGTRALAAEFGVNDRVVLAALRALADDGFVELRPRSGAYVAAPHPAGDAALPDPGAWLVSMLVQARARGVAPRALPTYLRRALATRRVRAACIECNSDQLHLLCSELADDHGFATESVECEALDAPGAPARALARADVLVTTMFHSAEVARAARELGKPWIVVALRPEILADVARHLAAGPVYYVATDERFEPKLRRMLGPRGRSRNLHVLLTGDDDLRTIPDDAPTFVMSSAREYVTRRFGRRGGPGIPIHPPRHFSDTSARELLAFLVRANMATLADAP